MPGERSETLKLRMTLSENRFRLAEVSAKHFQLDA